MVSVIIALLVLFATDAHATRYWVASTGSDTNSCASVDGDLDPGVYRATPAAGVSCLAAGDTLTILAGTYTGTGAVLSAVPAGTSSTTPTIIEGDPNDQQGCAINSNCSVMLQPSSGNSTVITRSNVTLKKLRINHINSPTRYPLDIQSSTGISHVTVEDVELYNTIGASANDGDHVGGGIAKVFVSFVTFRRVHVHDVGNTQTVYGHGLYIQGDDALVEDSLIHNAANSGIQCYYALADSDGRPDRCTMRRNVIRDNARTGIIVEGYDDQIYHNVIYNNGTNGILAGFGGALRLKVYKNTIYGNSLAGIGLRSTNTDTEIKNNIITGNGGAEIENISTGTGLVFSYNACTAAESCGSTGKLTITSITDLVVSTSNFNLKTGSIAINAGTAVTGPTCHGTCDIGAFEAIPSPAATIDTNTIRLIFPLNGNVPIVVPSTTGVSVACTGHASCPSSTTISSATRVTNADTQVDVVISGITGNACQSTQTWTISYTPGTWTDTAAIGGLSQPVFAFSNLAVVNACSGSGPPAGSTAHITYAFENGSGTTVSDTSGNALHGTTSGTWVSGKTGFGINVANGTTQQVTVPYGSGIDPTSQSMTWVVPVYIPTGTTSTTRYLFGPELGTNQRGYIGSSSGTWRMARQSTTVSAAGASNLAVVEGWNHLCARWDSTTDTVTLYNNGVAGTGGATGSYTSYTFSTNFEFPLIGTNLHTTVPEATFDDVQVFTTLEDCASLYAVWNAPPPPAAGTLAQTAVQFQGIVLDTAGSPIVVGPSVQSIEVPAGGGAVLLFQVHCMNVSDCALTAFKLVYANSVVPTTYQQVPDTETADGTWMWGVTTDANLNNGTRSTRLTGSCTLTNGTTQVTADQIPPVDLPQDGCIVLAYIVRVGSSAIGTTFEYRLLTEAGLSFTGGYDQIARIRVVNPMSSGIGF